MHNYQAPVQDINFVLREIAGIEQIASLPGFAEATPDLVATIVDGAAQLTGEVIAPTNYPASEQGARLANGEVIPADGLTEAYRQLVEGGWVSLSFEPQWGGQGLPAVVFLAVQEMLMSANLGFSLCPMLTYGAVEAIMAHGSDTLKQIYLPKMVSGEWTGTMNLTEPQAGTDLAAIQCRAQPDGDHYRIKGQKIFITWGDHNMTDNLIHLVLARLPDAPAGVKGISLFLVPKYLVDENGAIGRRNDVYPVALEHKLGIHASPTCVMSYGDTDGAIGYLVGERHQGVVAMFTMMNHARLTVGLQGVAVAERAYQQAVSYARDRVQGTNPATGKPARIIQYPDIRRMLLLMKSLTEAGRALAYVAMAGFDRAHKAQTESDRRTHQARLELLTPIVKGWCTEIAQEVTYLAIQVHGGMGFIEETGVAQHYRDARILPIYEGTNGIQALDLVGRKFLRDKGQALTALLTEISATIKALESRGAGFERLAEGLKRGVETTTAAAHSIAAHVDPQGHNPSAAAFNFLMLTGTVVAGWLMAQEALAATTGNGFSDAFNHTKKLTADFYFAHVLPRQHAYAEAIAAGSDTIMAVDEQHFCL